MQGTPRKETHYDVDVWVNPVTESLRRQESLCYNCQKFNPNQKGECPIARKFFEACKEGHGAIIVSRCEVFEPRSQPSR